MQIMEQIRPHTGANVGGSVEQRKLLANPYSR